MKAKVRWLSKISCFRSICEEQDQGVLHHTRGRNKTVSSQPGCSTGFQSVLQSFLGVILCIFVWLDRFCLEPRS